MVCPHCEAPAKVRSSREVTRLVVDRHYQCTDVDCGHVFVAQLAIVRTIHLSRKPRAGVHIPFGAPRIPPAALPVPANDPVAAVAVG